MAKRKAKLVAGETLAPAALITNDATNVYQLPDGSFGTLHRRPHGSGKDDPRYMPHDNIPGRVRRDRPIHQRRLACVGRIGSAVIQADAQDPTDLQHYYLSVTHTAKGRIGMLGHYRSAGTDHGHRVVPLRGRRAWNRPARTAWLPRSEPHTLAG